ncbi:peptidase [Haloferula helveola]|uniref:Peptidase n=2 Tax=Haloferula helveola TaxID=490095 RepID=A0ABM7RAU0_9BACT|nr:peptidase [Haloferula helveola]
MLVAATFGWSVPFFAEEAPWKEILGPPQGEVPDDPGGRVVWRDDFPKSLEEARRTGRPLLVTWRCLPCKQCADFDQAVLDGGEALDPLLRRFVTVRLTDASLLDERYFPYRTHQDLDLSWWAYFLSPEGDYYGVFGGKDHVSDTTRMSEAAFVNTLRRVLEHHHDPRRETWGIDLPHGTAATEPKGPKDMEGYRLLLAKRPGMANPHPQHGSCLHCHQVGDMLTLETLESDTFKPDDLLGKWPLPENAGIRLDRDDGLLVNDIDPGSPAELAGLRTGDRLGMAGGMRLFGQADFRGVLHRLDSGATTVPIAWTRDGDVRVGRLSLKSGWRTTENWWRKTVYDGVYGPGMGFFPLAGPRFGKGQGLSVKPWMGPKPAERPIFATGLRPSMEIVAINGMKDDMEIRKLIAWFRFNHSPGDEIRYTVKGGQEFRHVLPVEE